MENMPLPWKAVARLMSYDVASRPVAQRRRNSVTLPLRVLDGVEPADQTLVPVPIADAPIGASSGQIRRGA